jgi:hypothetical protein
MWWMSQDTGSGLFGFLVYRKSEGKTFLGSVTATASGTWSLTLSPGQVSKGQRGTTTATTTSTPLETSEFAANVVVTS